MAPKAGWTAGTVLGAALALLAASACRVAQIPPAPARPSKVVMGYYASWTGGLLDHTGIPFAHLTHIAHAFAWPDPSGNLVVPPGFLYPELNAAARAHGVKMILSLGGWGNSSGFPGTCADPGNRARFIGQVVDFCRANAYDGVDLDWEFVNGEEQRAGFTRLVEGLGEALKAQSPPLLLTMAAPSNNFHGRWIEYERLAAVLDYVGFMTYDYHGSWSDHSGHDAPLYAWPGDGCGSVDETFRYALGRGIPAEKILVGLHFMGRSFDTGGLSLPFKESEAWAYAEIMALPDAEWALVWDAAAQVPSLRRRDGSMIIAFDDMRSIALKCQYVKDRGAAGVLIWELSQDRRSGTSELLEVVGRSFRSGARPAVKAP